MEISSVIPTKKTLGVLKKFHKKCFNGTNAFEDFPFPKDRCYLAKIGDELMGMGMLHMSSPQEYFSSEYKIKEHMYLYNFCIHPDYQNKNYGKRLFEFIKKDNKELNLSVDKNSIGVIKFYLKVNCRILGKYNDTWICLTTQKNEVA